MYKMTISGLAEGREIVIDGLGSFSNGTYEIDARQAQQFRLRQSTVNPETPTLLEAFKGHPTIKVETVAKQSKAETAKPDNDKGGDK